MDLLVAVVEDPRHVEDILESLYENGIGGATVLESRGMGHMIAHRYSIFSRLSDLAGSSDGATTHNNVIFTVIDTDEKLDLAIEIITDIVGDLDRPRSGILFTVPVGRVKGINTPLGE